MPIDAYYGHNVNAGLQLEPDQHADEGQENEKADDVRAPSHGARLETTPTS